MEQAVGLDVLDRHAGFAGQPSLDGRLLALRRTHESEVHARRAHLTIAGVVVLIPGRRVVGCDVLRLTEVADPASRVHVGRGELKTARRAAPIGRIRGRVGERTRRRVDLTTGAETALRSVAVGRVGIRATDAQVRAVRRVAVRAAQVVAQRVEAVLEPALAELLEASRARNDAVAVQVAADDRVLIRTRNPVQPRVADVARRRAERDRVEPARGRVVADAVHVADDDVRADVGDARHDGPERDRAGTAGSGAVARDLDHVAVAGCRVELRRALQSARVVVATERRAARTRRAGVDREDRVEARRTARADRVGRGRRSDPAEPDVTPASDAQGSLRARRCAAVEGMGPEPRDEGRGRAQVRALGEPRDSEEDRGEKPEDAHGSSGFEGPRVERAVHFETTKPVRSCCRRLGNPGVLARRARLSAESAG